MYLQRQRKNLSLCLSLWFGPFNIMGLCVNGVSQISLFLVLNRIREGSLVANWMAALRRVVYKMQSRETWETTTSSYCQSLVLLFLHEMEFVGQPVAKWLSLMRAVFLYFTKAWHLFLNICSLEFDTKFLSNWLNVLCYLLLKDSSNFRRKDWHFC